MSQAQPAVVQSGDSDSLADAQVRRGGPPRIIWEPPLRNFEYDSINIPRAGRRAWPVSYTLNETFAAVGHPPRLSTNGEVVLRLADELCQVDPGLLDDFADFNWCRRRESADAFCSTDCPATAAF